MITRSHGRIASEEVVYSAMGHRAEAFAEPEHRRFLLDALRWVLRAQPDPPPPVTT